MTGEQLFLRYAFPCAESRVIRGKLDEAHLEKLKSLAQSGGQPNRQLLRYCFPHAFRRLREFGKSQGLTDGAWWSLETVRCFWRQHHGHRGECQLRRVVVGSVEGRLVSAIFNDTQVKAINFYNLPIRVGEEVYLHLGVVVEKAES